MRKKDTIARVHRYIDEHFDEHLESCRRLLRQPSISSSGEGILETAAVVRRRVEELGGRVQLEGDPAFPIIYGRVGRGDRPNLIIYGMYDVQPVEAQKWASPPFAAEIHESRRFGPCVRARGAVNSKGALAGLFNALRSIQAVDQLPLDLTFTIEGEEEIGSPHFEPFIRAHQEELTGIGVADFDFSEDARGNVSLHLGLKGIVYLELKCRGGTMGAGGSSESQHSSMNAWITSPVWRLVHALSTLVDRRERITIEGFYDNVAPVSRRDRRLLGELSEVFDEKAFLREIKAVGFKYPISGVDLLKKGLFSPIINIDGIHAGYAGSGSKTVLPRVATAKLDVRFGPDMEPEEVQGKLRRHLDRHGYGDIVIVAKDSYTWSKTDVKEPIVQDLLKAYRLHGKKPQVWPMATWTAPYHVFSRILRLPVVAGGLGYGERAHSPNELMTVEGLRDFEKWVVTFLYELAS